MGRVVSRTTGAILPGPQLDLPEDAEDCGPDGSFCRAAVSRDGRWLASANGGDQTVYLWDLSAPAGAEPLVLRRGTISNMTNVAFHPEGRWLAVQSARGLSLWPLVAHQLHVSRDPQHVVATRSTNRLLQPSNQSRTRAVAVESISALQIAETEQKAQRPQDRSLRTLRTNSLI